MKSNIDTHTAPVISVPRARPLTLEVSQMPLHQLASNLRLDLPPLNTAPLDLAREANTKRRGPIGKKQVELAAPSLLIDAKAAAELCGMARTTWFKMRNGGKVPDPVRFGRVVRWSIHELERWIEAGSPPAHRWRAIKDQQSRREKR